MTTACAPAPPPAVTGVWAEMVASLANMLESALTGSEAGGEPGSGAGSGAVTGVETTVSDGSVSDGPVSDGPVSDGPVGVVADDPGRVEGDRGTSSAGGDRLCSPVDADAGPRAHRVDDAAVRPGRAGGPARLGRRRYRGDRRRSGAVGPVGHASRRGQAPGRPGLSGRGGCGVRAGGLPAGPVQRGPGPPAGTGPPDRHPGHRQRRGL